MKIKPVFIYLTAIVIAIIAILFYSKFENSESSQTAITSVDINNEKMPNDSVHAKFNQMQQPSESNVSMEFKNRMKNLEDYVIKNPNDTAKVKQYADLLFAAHNPTKSIEFYKTILVKDPKRTDIMMNLTLVNFNENNISEAEKYTNQILKINPNNLEAIYNSGVIAVKKGNIQLAKENWGKLVRDYPNTEIGKTAASSLEKLNN
jgi:tetratricopeptide (TPR) repeat protein